MYGLIILTVKDLIVKKFGEKTWKKICAAANVADDYVQSQNYPEDILYSLAGATAKALDISVPQVVEAAGYWFIPYVLTTEYGRMLQMAGKTFSECLKNLNAMHGHLRIAHFNSMSMPNIRCTLESERRAKIQYTPGKDTRKGLGSLLVGLVYALAEIVYGITEVSITPMKQQAKQTYEEYLLVWSEENDLNNDEDDSVSSEEMPLNVGVTGTQLGILFPFHVLFNEGLEVIQWGPSMSRIAPLIAHGKKFSSVFTITSPVNTGMYNSDDCLNWQNELIMMKCGEVILQGQLMVIKNTGAHRIIGFFGSPKFKNIDEATSRQLSIPDFAIHDQTKDALFAIDAQTFAAAAKATKKEKKKEKERDRKHKSKAPADAPTSSAAGATGGKHEKAPAGLHAPFTGPMDPKKSLYANLFGSNVKEPDPHKLTFVPSSSNMATSRKTAKIEADLSAELTSSQSSPVISNSAKMTSPERLGVGHVIVSGGSRTGKAEEIAVPNGSYLPRLTAAFHELWLKESWHKFPLTRTIILTAFQLETTDEKPTQNMYVAVSRLALAKQRLSALIRAILEPEISEAINGSASLLRADSPATRIIHAAFDLSGGLEYLRAATASTLQAIQSFAEKEEKSLETATWEKGHAAKVTELAQGLLDVIFASAPQMPSGVRRILIDIHDLLSRRIPDMAFSAAQVLLFLRFVNPSIISPERFMFGRRHTTGGIKVATAVAKAIQALVNMSDEKVDSPLTKGDNQVLLIRFIKDLLDETRMPAFPIAPDRTFALGLSSVQEFMIENLEKLLATTAGSSFIAKEARASLLSFISVALAESVLRR